MGGEVCFPGWEQAYEQGAVLVFGENWSLDVRGGAVGEVEADFDGAGAANLETILHGGAGGEGVIAEAGGRVVDFKLVDGDAGLILHGGVDPVAFAPGEEGEQEDGGEEWGLEGHGLRAFMSGAPGF